MTDRQKTGNSDQDVDLWLKEHGDYLYRYALFRLSSEELARDMVQETLIAAWKASFHGDSSLRTWLVGIMKHKIIDHVRKEIRTRQLSESLETDPTSTFFDHTGHWNQPPQGWHDDPEALSSNRQFSKVLQGCVGALPDIQKHVFTLREMNGEDTQSVCNSCDISPTNLHVIMHRARLALRNCLEKNWFGNGNKDE